MAKRKGVQPGQVGAVRYKDIDTKGVIADQVLVSDGVGRTKYVSPGSIVGATELDELSDVGSAPETSGFILSANGTQYNGISPDAAGIIDKTTVQTIAARKDFGGGIKTTAISPVSGSIILAGGRIAGANAVALNELATLEQVLAAGGNIVTLAHPASEKNPDFNFLGDAIEGLTAVGGGIILILDDASYEAVDIDGTNKDLRNIVIYGQPGADPIDQPFIRVVAESGLAPTDSSSSSAPVPVDIFGWHFVGCRLGRKSVVVTSPDSSLLFALLLEECSLTISDPFNVSVGGDEGVVEIDTASTDVVVKHTYVEAGFRANANAHAVLASGNTVNVRWSGMRPNTAADTSAVIRMVYSATATFNIFHDGSVIPEVNGGSTITLFRTDGASDILLNPGGTTVDMKVAANTTLFTVPGGVSVIANKILVVIDGASAITVDAAASVGFTAATYDNISVNQVLVNMRTVDDVWEFPSFARRVMAQAADVITFKVNTGATGTTLTAKVYLFGILL